MLTNGIAVSVNELRDPQLPWARDSLVFILGNVRCKNVLEFLGSTNVPYKLFSFLQVIIART